MYLDPAEAHNYNGFVHPAYISHVETFAKIRSVKILDTVVANADSLDWAKKGLLNHFSVNGGCARIEALVIKKNIPLLTEFLDQQKTSLPELQWIRDYYRSSPEESISTLMSAIENPTVIKDCSMLAGAMLVEDMDFTDANDVAQFLGQNAHSSFSSIAANIALGLSLHYCSTPQNIRRFEQSVPPANFVHIECASLWAKLGDEEKCRHHLQMAIRKTEEHDMTMWRAISLKHLTLLGDFDQADAARKKLSIDTSSDGLAQAAIDLMVYWGTPDAHIEAEQMMYHAEACTTSKEQHVQLSYLWLNFFGNQERSDACRSIAES